MAGRLTKEQFLLQAAAQGFDTKNFRIGGQKVEKKRRKRTSKLKKSMLNERQEGKDRSRNRLQRSYGLHRYQTFLPAEWPGWMHRDTLDEKSATEGVTKNVEESTNNVEKSPQNTAESTIKPDGNTIQPEGELTSPEEVVSTGVAAFTSTKQSKKGVSSMSEAEKLRSLKSEADVLHNEMESTRRQIEEEGKWLVDQRRERLDNTSKPEKLDITSEKTLGMIDFWEEADRFRELRTTQREVSAKSKDNLMSRIRASARQQAQMCQQVQLCEQGQLEYDCDSKLLDGNHHYVPDWSIQGAIDAIDRKKSRTGDNGNAEDAGATEAIQKGTNTPRRETLAAVEKTNTKGSVRAETTCAEADGVNEEYGENGSKESESYETYLRESDPKQIDSKQTDSKNLSEKSPHTNVKIPFQNLDPFSSLDPATQMDWITDALQALSAPTASANSEKTGGKSIRAQRAQTERERRKKEYAYHIRHYVHAIIDEKLDEKVRSVLVKLNDFQERWRHIPAKFQKLKRLVVGIREIERGIKRKDNRFHADGDVFSLLDSIKGGRDNDGKPALLGLIIAPNLDASQGLDQAVENMIESCAERDIPVVFALSRRGIGYALKRLKDGNGVSAVGILSAEGQTTEWKEVLKISRELQEKWMEARMASEPEEDGF